MKELRTEIRDREKGGESQGGQNGHKAVAGEQGSELTGSKRRWAVHTIILGGDDISDDVSIACDGEVETPIAVHPGPADVARLVVLFRA